MVFRIFNRSERSRDIRIGRIVGGRVDDAAAVTLPGTLLRHDTGPGTAEPHAACSFPSVMRAARRAQQLEAAPVVVTGHRGMGLLTNGERVDITVSSHGSSRLCETLSTLPLTTKRGTHALGLDLPIFPLVRLSRDSKQSLGGARICRSHTDQSALPAGGPLPGSRVWVAARSPVVFPTGIVRKGNRTRRRSPGDGPLQHPLRYDAGPGNARSRSRQSGDRKNGPAETLVRNIDGLPGPSATRELPGAVEPRDVHP